MFIFLPKEVLPPSMMLPWISHFTRDDAVTSLNNKPNGFSKNSCWSGEEPT